MAAAILGPHCVRSQDTFTRNERGWSLAKYSKEDAEHLARKLTAELGQVFEWPLELERNSRGDELFVYGENLVVSLGRDGIPRMFPKPGEHARLGDDHDFVAWFSPEGVLTFSSGFTASLPTDMDMLTFSEGARYFMVTEGDGESMIYGADSPRKVLASIQLIQPRFSGSRDTLYVAGNVPGRLNEIEVLVYRNQSEGLSLQQRRRVKRPSGRCCSPYFVSDVKADWGVVAVADTSDTPFGFLSTLYVIAVDTGAVTETGRPGSYTDLFLSDDLLSRYLDR